MLNRIFSYQLAKALTFIVLLVSLSGLVYTLSVGASARSTPVVSADCSAFDATQTTHPSALTPNLLANADLTQVSTSATPTGWFHNNWGANTPTFTYQEHTDSTHSGQLHVAVSSYSSGDAKWYPQPIAAQSNQSYLFKNRYQSTVDTQFVAQVLLSSAQDMFIHVGNAPASASWTQTSFVFTTPPNAQTVTVFQVLDKVGTLSTDSYYLGTYTPQPLQNGLVTLSFDDGAEPIYQNALPLLIQYQMTSTQYLISQPLEGSKNPYYMTPSQDIDVFKRGNEIGAHTITHANLTDLTTSQVDHELAQSQRDIAALTGVVPQHFASPFGAYNAATIAQIKRYYCSQRSTEVGYNSPDNFNRYDIQTQSITKDTTLAEAKTWLNYAQQHHVWLVLVFHEVEPMGRINSYSPQQLEDLLKAIKASNLRVVSMTTGITTIASTQAQK
jgi:peptidoglycan/xylan/chitin deacetylase (PgdA/CDA1 family)